MKRKERGGRKEDKRIESNNGYLTFGDSFWLKKTVGRKNKGPFGCNVFKNPPQMKILPHRAKRPYDYSKKMCFRLNTVVSLEKNSSTLNHRIPHNGTLCEVSP